MPPTIDETEIARRFDYHAPDAERQITHEQMRATFKGLAYVLALKLPEGREKSLAFTALEEAGFWVNAAIAREGK